MADSQIHELQEFLADRDVPCPGCGYNLRGLPVAFCPECRQELHLTVGLAEPRLGSLIVSIGALFAGSGAAAALLVTIFIISGFLTRGLPRRTDEQLILIWLPLACLLTCGFFAWKLCRRNGRVWFRKLTHTRRRLLVAMSILLPLAWFDAFLALLLLRL